MSLEPGKRIRETTARAVLFNAMDCEKELSRAKTALRRTMDRNSDNGAYVNSAQLRVEEARIAASEAWSAVVRFALDTGMLKPKEPKC